jgi:hypothetical protein
MPYTVLASEDVEILLRTNREEEQNLQAECDRLRSLSPCPKEILWRTVGDLEMVKIRQQVLTAALQMRNARTD